MLRENGPVVLVPLAWGFAVAAHAGALSTRAVVIGHAVMLTIVVAFVASSWSAMARGALRYWRAVLLVGVPLTAAGLVGVVRSVAALQTLAVVGWMVVPGVALGATARRVTSRPWAYRAGAGLSLLGAASYLAGLAATETLLYAGLAVVARARRSGSSRQCWRTDCPPTVWLWDAAAAERGRAREVFSPRLASVWAWTTRT
jgi:hypothetical protein